MQYGTGLGIVAGIVMGPVPIATLPSTSTDATIDMLALLQTASVIWTGLLVVIIAIIATGLFRIARIPS